uniref:Growth associated protein 43 n=1 Tax=Neogobius melanostomus TaxID=47308 RepID=A0A8C6TP80_9GOBI
MLCCVLLVHFVEKNEDADQKIEQDGTANKPEENKAHKAATKIQASFRGHITRKKMKDGEEEQEEEVPVNGEEIVNGIEEGEEAKSTEEGNEDAPAKESKKEESQAKSPAAEKPPAKEEPKVEEKVEEKPKEVEVEPPAAKSPTTAPPAPVSEEKAEEQKSEEKTEDRQADVPAAVSPTADKEEPNQTKEGNALLSSRMNTQHKTSTGKDVSVSKITPHSGFFVRMQKKRTLFPPNCNTDQDK